MRSRMAVVRLMLAMAPLGAEAADLVVWWEKGYTAQVPELDCIRRVTEFPPQQEGMRKPDLVFLVLAIAKPTNGRCSCSPRIC